MFHIRINSKTAVSSSSSFLHQTHSHSKLSPHWKHFGPSIAQRHFSYLVGFDGSIHSKYALQQTLRRYMRPKDDLFIVNYYEGSRDSRGVSRSPLSEIDPSAPQNVVDTMHKMQADMDKLVDELQAKYSEVSIDGNVEYHPSPKYGLLETCERLNTDTIVLGSYGLNKFSRMMAMRPIGSTAEFIVRHSRCNVLVVKDEEALKDEDNKHEGNFVY